MSQEKRQRETEGAADRFLDLVVGSAFWSRSICASVLSVVAAVGSTLSPEAS